MSTALYGTVLFAVGAGAATFFAPCSYALLPGYVGYYVAATDRQTAPLPGALSRGVAAAVGALGTFLLLGGLATIAGNLIETLLPAVEPAVGVVLIALGVTVLAGKTESFHVSLPKRRSSVLGFGLFGAMYALASAACVLPLFLALVVQSLTLSGAGTIAVLGAYGGVVAAMLLAVTVATAVGRNASVDRFAVRSGWLVSIGGSFCAVSSI